MSFYYEKGTSGRLSVVLYFLEFTQSETKQKPIAWT
jgi:hypothetical protein